MYRITLTDEPGKVKVTAWAKTKKRAHEIYRGFQMLFEGQNILLIMSDESRVIARCVV